MYNLNFIRGLRLVHCPVMDTPSINALTTILNDPSNDSTTTNIIVKALATRTCESRIAFVKDGEGKIITAVPYILGSRSVGVKLALTHLEYSRHELERIQICIINGLNLFTGLRVVGYPAEDGGAKITVHKPATTVWVDSDQTLVDWFTPMLQYANANGYEFTNIHEFNAHPDCREIVAKAYAEKPNYFLDLEAIPLSIIMYDALLAICEGKARVRILTAVGGDHDDPSEVTVDKIQNLTSLYPVSVSDIHVVHHSADKMDYMQEEDILIDDYSLNITQANSIGIHGIKYRKDMGTMNRILEKVKDLLVEGISDVA